MSALASAMASRSSGGGTIPEYTIVSRRSGSTIVCGWCHDVSVCQCARKQGCFSHPLSYNSWNIAFAYLSDLLRAAVIAQADSDVELICARDVASLERRSDSVG